MQELFDRLAATPLVAKVGALVGLVVLLTGGYWYFFYDELISQEVGILRKRGDLQKEKAEYERRKAEYLKFRKEVQDLMEEQKSLLQVLPKNDDIEQFIENVQAQVELAGLQKVSSTRDAAMPMDLYTKIPIRMTAVGSYHQINQFFKSVGELKRIVNIEDLQLTPTEGRDPSKVALKATFVATTFQYLDKHAGGARGSGASINAGGR